MCDDMVVMAGGRVIMTGRTDEVFSQADVLAENGLDIPEISKLMLMLRERGIELERTPYTVSDALEIIKKELGI